MTGPRSILLHNLWGSQSWLPPAFSRREDSHRNRLLNLDEVLNK